MTVDLLGECQGEVADMLGEQIGILGDLSMTMDLLGGCPGEIADILGEHIGILRDLGPLHFYR